MLRPVLCWMMLAFLPLSMSAADMDAAIVYTSGPASLNGSCNTSIVGNFPRGCGSDQSWLGS